MEGLMLHDLKTYPEATVSRVKFWHKNGDITKWKTIERLQIIIYVYSQ